MVTVTEWSLFGSTRVEVTATTELTWDHIHHDEVRGMPSVQALRELGWGDDL
jgi:hypothetical protein